MKFLTHFAILFYQHSTGDTEKNKKVAFVCLVKLLCKRTVTTPLIYIYEECKQTDDPYDIAKRSPIRPEPRFFFPGEQPQYFVIVENEVLCICNSFSHALMIWFMSHYVFNLEYSVKVREVGLFVQEILYGLLATSGLKRYKTATSFSHHWYSKLYWVNWLYRVHGIAILIIVYKKYYEELVIVNITMLKNNRWVI